MNKIDQRIDGLYQNWQVEYKEAITSEQCEDIQRFYEPYVKKYETKYKMLYQMLKQAIDERNRAPSSRVTTSELTPSLVALEDASTLKRKEWHRGEPDIKMPHMLSTIDGRLTPTAPTYEDMKTETPLDVTPEESLEELSAAVGGIEDERATQQHSDHAEGMVPSVAPPSSIETRPKVISASRGQEELPRRTEITGETSRGDAIATTRCFFSAATERRSATDVPVTTTMSVTQTDTPPVTSVPMETEHHEPETLPERTFLPSGSSPRPTATPTLRPRMREQRISEGQIEEQSQDDGDSEESAPLEPLVMEGLPDELGPEWRVLHPFDIPGVRCPTEDTPPNHRRLAENDTLVELIQTAEYLEDAPSWEQRRFYPPRYGDPYFRGHGRGCGRGRGRGRGWFSEDVTERDTGGGRGRFYSCGNGRNGQYRNGFASSQDVGRRVIRLGMPPEPEPSRFSDWSSLASPPARTSPHGVPDVQTEQLRENRNIPARPAISPRTQRGTLESNEENLDIIPPMPIRSARSSLHADDVVLPRNVPRESSTNDDIARSSQM